MGIGDHGEHVYFDSEGDWCSSEQASRIIELLEQIFEALTKEQPKQEQPK